jgi:asparagine N-glycosylation enzyme membrane subunit Stt3
MAKFKLKSAQLFFTLGILIVLVVTFLPNISFSIYQAKVVPSEDDISAFVWIKNNTPINSVVLVMSDEGSAMSYFSSRKNVMDENYLLINSIDSRYDDVSTLYDARFITTALETLNYYSVDYVVLSEKTGLEKNRSCLGFESDCVSRVYPVNVDLDYETRSESMLVPGVFKVNCVLRQR